MSEPTHLEFMASHLVERFTGEIGDKRLDINELANLLVLEPRTGNWELTYQELHVLRWALEEACKTSNGCKMIGGSDVCSTCEAHCIVYGELTEELALLKGENLEHWTLTFCPQCGPNVKVDEDGCCPHCGSDSTGPGVEALRHIIDERNTLREENKRLSDKQKSKDAVAIPSVTATLNNAKALHAIAMLAEQRRKYDRDECCIRMGDVANRAIWNRRGPGTGELCRGVSVKGCPDCTILSHVCLFHSKKGP